MAACRRRVVFAGAQGATALRAEGCGIALGHTFGVKVLKMDRPDGRKVLKFDGPSGRGLWYRPWTHLRCEGS